MPLTVKLGAVQSVLSAVVGLALLCGCATSKPPPALPRTGDALVDGRTAIAQGPAKDKVLWEYRTALTALRRGQPDEAKGLLDDALLSLGGINPGDKDAKKARSMFNEESKKTFKGEPYERVMAYYYRGILYWRDGEADNARACFRSAQLQDSDTENKQFSSDYVLLDYLDGLASTKLAADGSDALKRAQAVSKSGPLPAYNPKANALFFIEFGNGPTKRATGEYGEQLRFREGKSEAKSAMIKIGDKTIQAPGYDNLNFQATTRGGRVMDHVLANKAVFKSGTDAFGNVAIVGGAITAMNRDTREIGLGLLALGAVSKIVSAATTPAADIRTWDNLPQFLSFAAAELPPGEYSAMVLFFNEYNQALPGLAKTVKFQVVPGRDTVIFVSDKS